MGMKPFSRLRGRKFCAFCRSPREMYVKKHADLTNVLGLAALSATITYGWWGEPDPRGLFIFCLGLAFAETCVYLRWRASMVCRLCGFDPLLYKKSPAAASEAVGRFYRERRRDPGFLLSRSPLLEVHRRALEADRRGRDLLELESLRSSRKLRQTRDPVRVAREPTVR